MRSRPTDLEPPRKRLRRARPRIVSGDPAVAVGCRPMAGIEDRLLHGGPNRAAQHNASDRWGVLSVPIDSATL